MTLTFTVRDVVPINRFYARGAGKRLYTTPEGKAFKMRIVAAAAVARANSGWPNDPFRVARARVSYQLYDYRGDTDGPRKVIRDSLERLLYVNDRCVEDGPAPFPIADGNGRRIVVTVELLKERSKEDAAIERTAHAQRLSASLKRRATSARKRVA